MRQQLLAEAENPGVSPKRSETLYRAAGEALRRQVWDPLEPALERSRRILLTPAGALNLVDFGALPARAEATWRSRRRCCITFRRSVTR